MPRWSRRTARSEPRPRAERPGRGGETPGGRPRRTGQQRHAPLAPAERHTVEFTADADPGIFLLHCHKVNHVMNGNAYPGGMLGGIVYEEAMDSDIFAQLMDYAGYEV